MKKLRDYIFESYRDDEDWEQECREMDYEARDNRDRLMGRGRWDRRYSVNMDCDDFYEYYVKDWIISYVSLWVEDQFEKACADMKKKKKSVDEAMKYVVDKINNYKKYIKSDFEEFFKKDFKLSGEQQEMLHGYDVDIEDGDWPWDEIEKDFEQEIKDNWEVEVIGSVKDYNEYFDNKLTAEMFKKPK